MIPILGAVLTILRRKITICTWHDRYLGRQDRYPGSRFGIFLCQVKSLEGASESSRPPGYISWRGK